MNLYETLGLERDATPAEVKAAFRSRAKDLHPDKGGEDEAFKKLSFAYMVLRDKGRRARYDKTGETSKSKVESDLQKISSVLLMLFTSAIDEGIASRSDLDLIKLMKQFLTKTLKEREKKVQEIGGELVKIQQLAERISCRKGNRNLFGSIINNRKEVLLCTRNKMDEEIRIAKLVLEELKAYDCLVEVVTMVEIYFVGGISSSTT